MIPPLLVLGAWPIVVFVLFSRMEPARAVIWSILAGYLLLPRLAGFNLPLFPLIDKDIVPAIAAIVAASFGLRQTQRHPDYHILNGWTPRSSIAILCILALGLGALGTTLTNSNPIIIGERLLPALQLRHAPPLIIDTLIALLPFLLARRFLGHTEGHSALLKAFAIAGLVYSIPTVYEVRMSPMLHTNIYGYFQHIWNQHVRGGGFRPIVFLQHGLWLSLFLSTAILSCLALFRTKTGGNPKLWLVAAVWLLLVLVLSKSLGALTITLVVTPIILFATRNMQMLFAAAIAATIMTYPILRGANLVPVDRISAYANSIDPARALSFTTRLKHEDALLQKAAAKPLFGWSTWGGRNRIYNEDGRDITLPDGRWIITLGASGWVGYLSQFGLLAGAIILLTLRKNKLQLDLSTACLAVVLAGNLIDLIPNATLTPITWLMAGALYGRMEHGHNIARRAAHGDIQPLRPNLAYSRFRSKHTQNDATNIRASQYLGPGSWRISQEQRQ